MTTSKWKKLLAFALSLIMMGSLITPILPTAQAVEEGLAAHDDPGTTDPDPGTGGGTGTVSSGNFVDYWDTDLGKPNLYVDFLGDNMRYRADREATHRPNTLVDPGAYNQSAVDDVNRDTAISGAVLDKSGNPVGTASVALLDAAQNQVDTQTTPGSSTYRFENFPAGNYTVAVTDPDKARLGYTLGGKVRDNKGAALAGVSVTIQGTGNTYTAVTDKTGFFCADVPDGAYTLSAKYMGKKGQRSAAVNGQPILADLEIPAWGVFTPAPGNTWKGYTSDDCELDGTIFWVGVGVDREQIFRLLEGNQGLFSLELGFYYNDRYIEPYTGPAGDFAAAITAANINNTNYPENTQWSEAYSVRQAVTDLPIADTTDPDRPALPGVTDAITRESMIQPSVEEILQATVPGPTTEDEDNWRMTYMSLELTDPDGARRLAGVYDNTYFEKDADGNYINDPPPAANGEDGPQYLMLIPFRLKQWDDKLRLCLRLIRDASHFSIGAGEEGDYPYAAWERTTTRNPGDPSRDIKLLTHFTGDLNIFTGKKSPEKQNEDWTYNATLKIVNGGDSRNYARLHLADDPSLNPVYVDKSNDYISNLKDGTGMQVSIRTQPGYTVSVHVYEVDETGATIVHQVVVDQKDYRFVMPKMPPPKQNVLVVVKFEKADFVPEIFLSEKNVNPRWEGNEALIEPTGYDPISSFDRAVSHEGLHPEGSNFGHSDGPAGLAEADQPVIIRVSTHANYAAKVRIYNFGDERWMQAGINIDSGLQASVDQNGLITLPHGGVLSFTMPKSNIDVEIEYVKAQTYTAYLEVWHDDPDRDGVYPHHDDNTAQLAFDDYARDNVRRTAYSAQVYESHNTAVTPETVDHRALKLPSKVIPWIPKSAAQLSDSLGGDNNATPGSRAWLDTDPLTGASAVMSVLHSAADASGLVQALQEAGHSQLEIIPGLNGFRRNLQKETYGDAQLYVTSGDTIGLANALWEMRTRIMNSTATPGSLNLSGTYIKEVPDDKGGVAFTYFDLTPAQVQAYLLEMLEADELARTNLVAYREVYYRYQNSYKDYQVLASSPQSNTVSAPIAPEIPRGVAYDASTGVRRYEGKDYNLVYLKSYVAYMEAYEKYIADLMAGTGTISPFDPSKEPISPPDMVTASILTDGDAQTKIAGQSWNLGTPSSEGSIRDGRRVWVSLEAESSYREVTVEIWRADADHNATVRLQTLTPAEGYKNVYAFDMPQEDCVVRVTYGKRDAVELEWEVVGADGMVDNLTNIRAYQVSDPEAVVPTPVTATNAGQQSVSPLTGTIERVLTGSTVTVNVKRAEGYNVEFNVRDKATGGNISYTQVTDPKGGTIYTFKVENNHDLKVTVAYTTEDIEHTAYIEPETYPGDPDDDRNSALWDDGSSQKRNVSPGAALVGEILVAPGYYIYSVTATGASGSYSYTLNGNGYNNGTGTYASDGTTVRVPIRINTTMPNEDLHVSVVFRKGIPPVEPANTLTLTVKDDDNAAAPYADNWARATVLPTAVDPASPVLVAGLGTTGGGGLTDSAYVASGRVVEVDYSAVVVRDAGGSVDPEKSYYLSSITVGPARLGVELEWLENGKVRFVMPPASAGITVEFKKGKAPTYFLEAYRTENGGYLVPSADPAAAGDNRLISVSSDTIASFMSGGAYPAANLTNPETIPDSQKTGGIGTAVAGEKVTVRFLAKKGWYVQNVVLANSQSAWVLPFTATAGANGVYIASGPNDGTAQTELEAVFTMPASNTEFIVNYRQEPKPDNPEYAANLIVRDRDNVDDPATGFTAVDNWVRGTYTNVLGAVKPAAPETLGTKRGKLMGVLYPESGNTVNVDYQLYDGFVIDYVAVTPSGGLRRIFPSFVAEQDATADNGDPVKRGRAYFTMPAQDVTVVVNIVRSNQKRQYTANLILRPPAGVDVNLVGQGTFIDPADPTRGSLESYPDNAIFSLLTEAGTPIDLSLFAKDGYYIRTITVDPATGAEVAYTGSFGHQSGSFVMPAADVNVNVWFEKLWPDQAEFDLTLEVIDPSLTPENYAAFRTAGDRTLDPAHVVGNTSKTVSFARDRERVVVDIHAASGFHTGKSHIKVTDSYGRELSWSYVPGRDGGRAIAFTMPPMSTKVTVTFLRDTDPDPDPPGHAYQATLHISGPVAGAASLTDSAATVTADGQSIGSLSAGDTLTLTVTKPDPGTVAAAYAVGRSTGRQLLLPLTPVLSGGVLTLPPDLTPDGGTVSFAMPEEDADVYVVFSDVAPGENDRRMDLIVAGPAGSGSASMAQDSDASNAISVTAAGADLLWAPESEGLTVTLTPQTGYYIAELTVTDGNGQALDYHWISMVPSSAPGINPVTWKKNDLRQFTLTVPPTGGTVYVRYEKIPGSTPDKPEGDEKYVAQIVVNDEEYRSNKNIPSRNDAWFPSAADDTLREKLKKAKPGEWIDLSLTVHAGYQIEYVLVVPQEFGLAPGLSLPATQDQSTGFYMPAGNVTVYVKFVRDDLTRYNIVLSVKGHYDPPADPGDPVNEASIYSDFSGTEGPIHVPQLPVSVQAAEGEWVTVDYTWDAQSSVESVTVTNAVGDPIPFTQVTPWQIKLPMVNQNIYVEVTYRRDPEPVRYPVTLHVIDKSHDSSIDTEAEGFGRLLYLAGQDYTLPLPAAGAPTNEDTGNVTALPAPGKDQTIQVPAGKLVDLTAFSGNDGRQIYIESAFVLYREGGQMIKLDLEPDKDTSTDPATVLKTFTGEKHEQFAVHPGLNDVYVTLTDVKPERLDYSAVLMIKGPASNTSSAATICVGSSYQTADRRDKVTVNDPDDPYAYVTAQEGETITVSVTHPGYVIDRVLITPLGDPRNPIMVWTNSTGTFTMPGQNVAITVYLKESSEDTHKVFLHYFQQGSDGTIRPVDQEGQGNRADVFWYPDGSAVEERRIGWIDNPLTTLDESQPEGMEVAENATVTVTATLDPGYTVLAAYVLRGTTLVPLSPAMEGAVEVNSTITNLGEVDATATFSMPGGETHVYLVVTDQPPAEGWRTAVLLVTDRKAGKDDQGENYADIKKTNPVEVSRRAQTGDPTDPHMGHEFITVWPGDPIRVTVGDAKPGYAFNRPATISHSSAGVVGGLAETFTSPFVYEYTAGAYNSAVHVHFVGADAEKNDLIIDVDDWDNPNDGSVTNSVETTPDGMTPLKLDSTTSAGAYQIIPGVEEGGEVTVQVDPHYDDISKTYDYHAVVTVRQKDGTEVPFLDGSTVASLDKPGSVQFTMPATETIVNVRFYRPHKATLHLVDLATTDPTSQAQMTEDFRDGQVFVHQITTEATLTDLPRGTVLSAGLTHLPETSQVRAVFLTVGGTTTVLSSTAVDEDGNALYTHTMGREDARITIVVEEKGANTLLARVVTVNKPASLDERGIAIGSTTAGAGQGRIWTSSAAGAAVTTTVPVPAGYEARVTARDAAGNPVTFDGGLTTVTLTAAGNPAFTMPNADVVVTITYVKTAFTLTLKVSGGEYADTAAAAAGGTALVPDVAALVAAGTPVDVTSTPKADARLVSAYYRTEYGGGYSLSTDPSGYTGNFSMPQADTVLYLVFAPQTIPTPDDPEPEENYYLALVETVGGDDLPNNRALSIQNRTRNTLPEASPAWAAGIRGDEMKVAFTTEPGWTATVTARRADNNGPVPVVQQGLSGDCYATVRMPGGVNVIITITYKHEDPPTVNDLPITLRLVDHDQQAGNRAQGSSDSGGLTGLSVAGVTAPDKSPISVKGEMTHLGERLTVVADWQSGYQIVRITVAVPVTPGTGNDITGNYLETDLPVSRYGSKATARLYVPSENAVVTVYYANIYTATLHIVGQSGADRTEMTDSRANPVTSTGSAPITNSGDRLLELAGGEEIRTTAVPDAASNKTLRGVVYESELTGAQATRPAVPSPNDLYTFDMPRSDTDVWVFYEEDTDEVNKTYIAKVAIDSASQGYGLSDGVGGRNRVSIRNENDPAAPGGSYWTGAKAGETVTVTVELIPGYQAVVTSAKMDDPAKRPTPETDFDFYVTRTRFVVTGKTTSFTMPAGTDTTLTVRYIKGYDLTLELVDNSAKPTNTATLSVADTRGGLQIAGINTGTANSPAYTVTDPSATPATSNGDTLHGLTAGDEVETKVMTTDPAVVTRVTYSTPFGGTRVVTRDASGYQPYDLPAENTVESVLFRDETKPDNLLAKVELLGHSDINGHGDSVDIIDATDHAASPRIPTAEGTIWTTTVGADTIQVTLRVAKGYVAKVKVRRDNDTYWNNLTDETKWVYLDAVDYKFKLNTNPVTSATGEFPVAFTPGTSGNAAMDACLSDEQTFTFTMPAAPDIAGDADTDVTVLIEYVYAGTIPAPYDPHHVKEFALPDGSKENWMPDPAVANLQEGFIYGENRGDYAIVDIPTLEQDGKLYNTDLYDPANTNSAVTFHFYLYDVATGVYTELSLTRDVTVLPVEEDDLRAPGDPYNYYDTEFDDPAQAGEKLVGSRLILLPRETAAGGLTANGQKLQEMLDNQGSLDAATHATRLYVTAVNVSGEESAYTELWIRPTYTLALRVASWGPGHPIDAALRPLLTQAELDVQAPGETLEPTNPAHYAAEALYTTRVEPLVNAQGKWESDKWQQVIRIRTSELVGDYRTEGSAAPLEYTYALTLEKAANIPYVRVNIVLKADEETGVADASKVYFFQNVADGVNKRTFSIQDVVTLIAGDADGDGLTKWQDYELIRRYVEGKARWDSTLREKPADYDTNPSAKARWDASVYNPESAAYRCDLNSDGVISVADLGVLTTYDNYNKSPKSYNWPANSATLPHGMKRPDYTGGVILFGLREELVRLWGWPDLPADYDPVGDAPVTPPELLAEREPGGRTPSALSPSRDETWETPADPPSVPVELDEPVVELPSILEGVVELPPVVENAIKNPALLPPLMDNYEEETKKLHTP